MYTTLVSTNTLTENLENPDWVILDCRFHLVDTDRYEKLYRQAHIQGAMYAHLEKDLSSPVIPGLTGRHPWPTVEQAKDLFSGWGIDDRVQVVVYDDAGGALAAVRAWWMLRWLGHNAVAVLDGGWQRWLEEDLPVRGGSESRQPRAFTPRPRPELILSSADIDWIRLNPAYRVFDCRLTERYHGHNETIDPIAGHIPGAWNAPYTENLTPEGVFHTPAALRQKYQALLGDIPAERAIFYCGSGVTSIFNILAILHAGLGEARLYAGSWSEWIAPGTRPVSTEEDDRTQ